MKFEKYMSFYRNDDLIINDEEIKGTLKDIREYFKYLLATQCMSIKVDYETLVYNARIIIDFLEESEYYDDLDENDVVIARLNPMGSIYIESEEE